MKALWDHQGQLGFQGAVDHLVQVDQLGPLDLLDLMVTQVLTTAAICIFLVRINNDDNDNLYVTVTRSIRPYYYSALQKLLTGGIRLSKHSCLTISLFIFFNLYNIIIIIVIIILGLNARRSPMSHLFLTM